MGKVTPKKLVIPITLFVTLILTWWSYSAALSSALIDVERLEDDLRRAQEAARHKVLHPIRQTGEPTLAAVSIPLFPTDSSGKQIKFPAGVTRVWLDVGAHRQAMMTRPSLLEQPDLAVIAFEPLYDNWGELNIKNHHERLFSIPAAVSTAEGYQEFRRAGTDMCSSLKGVNADAQRKDWPGGCTETSLTYEVPTLRLDTVIKMIPSDVTIEFLKVDAQGGDYDVVSSAGVELARIATAVIEVQLLRPLYQDSASEEQFKSLFAKSGFRHAKTKVQNLENTEANMFFRNEGMEQPKDGVLPVGDILREIAPKY